MTDKDNVLKFPTKGTAANNSKISDIMSRKNMPAKLADTDTYAMMEVEYSAKSLKSYPDLETGGQRNRRWAAIVSLGIIPGFEETPVGPVLLPKAPSQLFTADDLDLLKERLFYEIEQSITLAKLAMEDPKGYSRAQMENMAGEMQESTTEQ